MSKLPAHLSVAAALIIGPAGLAQAQDPDGSKGPIVGLSQSGGTDDIDDLLDPELGEVVDPTTSPKADPFGEPPAAVKAAIDARARAIGEQGAQLQAELTELTRLGRQDRSRYEAELGRRIADADGRLNNLQAQVEQLSGNADARARTRVRGYGDPLSLDGSGRGAGRQDSDQYKWWDKTLHTTTDGVDRSLQALVERRANALKAEADAVALGVDPKYRSYADGATRRELERSLGASTGQAQAPSDNRLNDLLLPGRTSNPIPVASGGNTGQAAARFDEANYTRRPGFTVKLLPRVKDPVTGKERVMIDYPLGME